MSFSGRVSACKPSASTILAYCMRCTLIDSSFLLGHSYVLGAIQTERDGLGLSRPEEESSINIVIHNNTLVSLKPYTLGGVCTHMHF